MSRLKRVGYAASAICLLAGVTLAQDTKTWDANTEGGTLWSEDANWSDGLPVDGDRLWFGGTTYPDRLVSTNDLTNLRFSEIRFWAGGAEQTLRGNDLIMGGKIYYNAQPGSARMHTIDLGLILNASRTIESHNNGAFHVSGNISETGGSRGLSIRTTNSAPQPTSYVRLSGTNTFSGILELDNRANLYVTRVENLGLGSIFIRQNANLFVEGDIETSQALTHFGANSTINVSSGKTLTLNGVWTANTGSAPRKVGPGDLVLNNSTNNMNDATLTVIAGGIYIGHANAMNNGTLKLNSSAARLDNVSGSAMTVTSMDGFDLTTGFEFLGTDDLDLSAIETSFIQVADSTRNIIVSDATLRISGIQTDDTTQTPGAGDRRDGSLVKSGEGTLEITSASDYTLGTTVAAGTLLVSNATGSGTGSGDVTVNAGAALGGSGIIDGDVDFEAEAKVVFNPNQTLTVNGTIRFNGLGIDDLVQADGSSINWSSISSGTYTIIAGNIEDFDEVDTDPVVIGPGRTAQFQEGSLQLVVTGDAPGPVVDPDIDSIGIALQDGDVVVEVAFDDSGSDTYTLQFRADLLEGTWTDVASGPSSPLSYTNETAQGFFRVKAE